MLTQEQNEGLTRVGRGTAMGDYLRRYWHPVAGFSEFEARPLKPIRPLGEDLVLYRDGSGRYGLMQRHCPHCGANMAYGMVEDNGLRCSYHGWWLAPSGTCVEQPFEDLVRGSGRALEGRGNVAATANPVKSKAGMLWAYMGLQPAPLVPDWEPFARNNGSVEVVLGEVPCNWLQRQENSIDPVHLEWMHENWGQRLRGETEPRSSRHLKLDFHEFEPGFSYHRIKEDTDAEHENWTGGRVCLWPNAFCLTEHLEWRVPIDDDNTLSVTWKFSRVPKEQEPYRQEAVPTWTGPTHDGNGEWTSRVINQDFLAWAGQGRIADSTKEALELSDKEIVLLRLRLLEELARVAAGQESKGLIRDAAVNVAVPLPSMNHDEMLEGRTKAEVFADPRLRMMFTSYVSQAGQPDYVRRAFEEAVDLESSEFAGLTARNVSIGQVA